MRDFRGAAKSPRQDDGANTSANVDLRGSHAVPANLVAQPLRGAPVNRAKQRYIYLAAMSMPRKNQAHVMPGGKVNNSGIVRQQNAGGMTGNSAHSPPQVRAVAIIVYSSKVHRLSTMGKGNVPIAHDF